MSLERRISGMARYRMSGPMYREEIIRPGPRPDVPEYKSTAVKLTILTNDLREVSFTMRHGTQVNAFQMAERALSDFLGPERVPVK